LTKRKNTFRRGRESEEAGESGIDNQEPAPAAETETVVDQALDEDAPEDAPAEGSAMEPEEPA
jgi:hypothetical protein